MEVVGREIRPEIPDFEKIRDVSWVNARGGVEVAWVSPRGGIGLKGAKQESFLLCLEVTVLGCDPDVRELKMEVSYLEDDEYGGVYHIDGTYGEMDLSYLVSLSRLHNQSEELTVNQILSDKGLPGLEDKVPEKKKRNLKLVGRSLPSLVVLLLTLGFLAFSLSSRKEVGAVTAPVEQLEEVALKNGATLGEVVQDGSTVKKGQRLARVLNPKLREDLTALRDRKAEARRLEISIKAELETKKLALKSQNAILRNAERTNDVTKPLVQSGFVSEMAALPKENVVLKERAAAEAISEGIRQLELSLETLYGTWGRQFTKYDPQIAELEKQIKSLDILSKCDCLVRIQRNAEYVGFALIDPKKPYFIEVPVAGDYAANLRDGQVVYYRMPDAKDFSKGVYRMKYVNAKQRVGLNQDRLNPSSSVITVIPDDPIVGGLEAIGKPVTVKFHQNIFSSLMANLKWVYDLVVQ